MSDFCVNIEMGNFFTAFELLGLYNYGQSQRKFFVCAYVVTRLMFEY